MNRLVLASLAALAPVTLIALASCIIADPPPDLPKSPLHRPTIVHGSVVPSTDRIMTTFGEFVIPVDLVDPTVPFEFNLFVDYDRVFRPNPLRSGRVDPGSSNTDGGYVIVDFSVADEVPDPSSCHVVEFLVANSFNPSSSHTFDSVGGDSVTWIYNPSGDPRGCPLQDAGTDGAFDLDATPDRIIVPETGGGG